MTRREGFEGLDDLASGEALPLKAAPGTLDGLLYVSVNEQPEGQDEFRASLAVRWQVLEDWTYAVLHREGLPSLGQVSVQKMERLDSGISFPSGLAAVADLRARVVLASVLGEQEWDLVFAYDTGNDGKGGRLGGSRR